MAAPKGYLALVLHAHLPFVRHPEHEEFLEEDWLYEAITETYLPLLGFMEAWSREGIDWQLTMSLTPTLCAMLDDELLRRRYLIHLERLIELADKEVERTRTQADFHGTALMYRRRFQECRDAYVNKYGRDIVRAFKAHQDAGHLEIITCGATHGFFPLMQNTPQAVEAQVAVAVDQYKRCFGRPPRGIWNPECGFFPGLDQILDRNGIRFFFADTHAVLFADRRPRYGVFAPLRTPGGPFVFGRDQESSKSVWSAELGYPGDPRYREFYRDIGFDAELDYIRPYIHPSGLRTATGIKYYKITARGSSLRDRMPYEEGEAMQAAAQHAGHFMFCRQQQVLHLSSLMDRPPLLTSPYDAELFGHWWFEGPQFLDYLVRKLHYDQDDVKLITPSGYLERFPESQTAMPSFSSWGYGGFSEVWLEGSNDWVYRHLDEAAIRMTELADAHPKATGITLRALNQCARELLLAQASDWAFIMKTNTVVDYVVARVKEHLQSFLELHRQIVAKAIDEKFLADLELRHNIFSQIDYKVYRTGGGG